MATGVATVRRTAFGAGAAFLSAAALTVLPPAVGANGGGRALESRGAPRVELTLRAVPGVGQAPVTPANLQRAAEIMRSRLQKLGVNGTVTVRPGSDLLVVRIEGAHVPARVTRLLPATAGLMFFDFERDLTGPSIDANGNPVATPTLSGLLSRAEKQSGAASRREYYLYGTTATTPKPGLIAGPTETKAQLLRVYGGKLPAGTLVLAAPPNTIVVSCPAANGCLGIRQGQLSRTATYYYLLRFDPQSTTSPVPELDGSDLVRSGTHADFGQAGGPLVFLQFNRQGAAQFLTITRREAQRGRARYDLAGKKGSYLLYVQHFAIVLDGVLETTPYIDFKQNPGGIPGPNAEMDMGNGGTLQDAKDLALALRTGTLPFQFILVSERSVP